MSQSTVELIWECRMRRILLLRRVLAPRPGQIASTSGTGMFFNCSTDISRSLALTVSISDVSNLLNFGCYLLFAGSIGFSGNLRCFKWVQREINWLHRSS